MKRERGKDTKISVLRTKGLRRNAQIVKPAWYDTETSLHVVFVKITT